MVSWLICVLVGKCRVGIYPQSFYLKNKYGGVGQKEIGMIGTANNELSIAPPTPLEINHLPSSGQHLSLKK